MKRIFGYIHSLKGYYRYVFLLFIFAALIFDLFISRPEEVTGARVKFLWGVVIFVFTLFSIILFKVASFIFYREDS